ncbi:MAG: hypothetical protein ABJA89_02645, partial [Lapillicoccus sp.]
RVVVDPTLALARSLDHVDSRLDDAVWMLAGTVTGVKRTWGSPSESEHGGPGTASDARGLAARAAGLEEALDDTVRWLAGRVRRLGRLARRPQTGQLHQYYLQAVAVLAVLLLLLLLPLLPAMVR